MGRTAKGWSLVWRRGVAHVRFTFKKERYELSTGHRVEAEAVRRAAELYADVVSGRWRPVVGSSTARLVDLIPGWLGAIEAELDEETVDTYGGYSKHWPGFFGSTLGSITKASASDYRRSRLLQVSASSVRKELSALRGFLSWCVEQEVIEEAPMVPGVSKKATGKRVGKRTKAYPLSLAEVERLLAALPARGRKGHPVRARFIVMYETSLRPATLDAIAVPTHYIKGATHLAIPDEDDKSRYGRRVPLSARAREALDAVAPDEGPVFGEHDYREVFANAVKAAGLPDVVVPYDLRHARLQHLTDAGHPLPGVAFMGGHLLLTTTNHYVRASQRVAEGMVSGVSTGVGPLDGPSAKEGSRTPTRVTPLEPERQASGDSTGIPRGTKPELVRGNRHLPTRTGVGPQSWVHEAALNLMGLLLARVVS